MKYPTTVAKILYLLLLPIAASKTSIMIWLYTYRPQTATQYTWASTYYTWGLCITHGTLATNVVTQLTAACVYTYCI